MRQAISGKSETEQTGFFRQLIAAASLPALICAAGVTLFWSLPANAQSQSDRTIDCVTADRPAEFAICNSEDLLTMDEELAKATNRIFINASTSPQRQAVEREHDAWIRLRNRCANDATCINLRYQERLSVISSRSS